VEYACRRGSFLGHMQTGVHFVLSDEFDCGLKILLKILLKQEDKRGTMLI